MDMLFVWNGSRVDMTHEQRAGLLEGQGVRRLLVVDWSGRLVVGLEHGSGRPWAPIDLKIERSYRPGRW